MGMDPTPVPGARGLAGVVGMRGAPVPRQDAACGESFLAGSHFHPTPSRRVSYGTSPLLSRHKSSGLVRSQDEVGWLESPH